VNLINPDQKPDWTATWRFLLRLHDQLIMTRKYRGSATGHRAYKELLRTARRRYHRPLASYEFILDKIEEEMNSLLATPRTSWKELANRLRETG